MFGLGNRHSSAFRLMFELTMATFRASQIPAIVFKQPDEVSDFHARIIGAFSIRWRSRNG